jgi:DNA-binding NarL/FixJ family response regulator
MIKVVIADDQELIRVGLRTLFTADAEIELVGEAATGPQAVAAVHRSRPDVVLLDIRMAGHDGLDALRQITGDQSLAQVRVIMLTTFDRDDYIFTSLQYGASGFILKDTDPAELLRAIRIVAAGEALLSPAVTRRVLGHFAARRPTADEVLPDLTHLTEREREIVAWVATGRSNDEIAAALVLSSATVRTHVSRALTKLQARDRAQLVLIALRAGLDIP